MVNKIPQELDNPIDNIINNHIDTQLNLYKKLGLTPNMITTISLMLGLSSSYLVYKDSYIAGAITWFLSYYFDCADGKMARKFKMTSQFGDLYDHSSDVLKHIIIFYILYNKLNIYETKKVKYLIIFLVLLIFILTLSQLGCQEKLTKEITKKKTESPTLEIAEQFVFTDCKTQMRYTRYFGPATIILYICIIMLYLSRHHICIDTKFF
jgi:phosphatidylglycerophosphate synthase